MTYLNILISGSSGFIGKNLVQSLKYQYKIFRYDILLHNSSDSTIIKKLEKADYLIHLAGVNRPANLKDFKDNYRFTKKICDFLILKKKKLPIIFSSTAHIGKKSSNKSKLLINYVNSKIDSETVLINFAKLMNVKLDIFRIPHVIGKFAKPNYNSVIATFCYKILRNQPVNISKEDPRLNIVHVDSLVNNFINIILKKKNTISIDYHRPKQFQIRVSEIADKINKMKFSIDNNHIYQISDDFEKILYSTLITYLPKKNIKKKLNFKKDKRGIFSEILKSKNFGQISFFTSINNLKRGNHYHNIKFEIFVVVSGVAEYCSVSLNSKNKKVKYILKGSDPTIIRTIPGDKHYIKNIGKKELIVLVWANENFDVNNPDTFLA